MAWPRDRRRRLRRSNAPSDRVFILDGEQWRDLHRLPEGPAAGGAAVVGDTLYVVGGSGQPGLPRAALALDLRPEAWRQIPGPTPREHPAATAAAGRVYALAGAGPADTTARAPRLVAWTHGYEIAGGPRPGLTTSGAVEFLTLP